MSPLSAEPIRIATYNVDLSRQGPGLLVRDILSGEDLQVAAVVQVVVHTAPDILLLTDFDFDLGLVALNAFADQLRAQGLAYDHLFALRPNTGMATGLDMDGDGRLGRSRDNQSYGRFAGQGGMALLSRWPIDLEHIQDFSSLLWKDFPAALLPQVDGRPFPSAKVQAVQRLSTTGHWLVPVQLPNGGRISLMAYYASPPVFDGPEDRNGKRNHDETAFWHSLLSGDLQSQPPGAFVILGDGNLDPKDGDGRHAAMQTLLKHPQVQDVAPASQGASAAATLQAGVNRHHRGDPAFDTADWPDVDGPGNLRVDYVLPSVDLKVAGAGVFWPSVAAASDWAKVVAQASRHRLVWVDVEPP